mgnify:CR=1 FL=1
MARRGSDDLGPVFRALGDDTRRAILDVLADGPRTTTDIIRAVGETFPHMSRFAVMKHLDVLRAADLVLTRSEGARRINTINAVPLHRLYARWVTRYQALWAGTLLDVQGEAEGSARDG